MLRSLVGSEMCIRDRSRHDNKYSDFLARRFFIVFASEKPLSQGRTNQCNVWQLSTWFEHDVKPRMRGECYLIRFADDFICSFQYESDARRYQAVLPKRLGRYSLAVAEDKTKLIRFGRFARDDQSRSGAPETFDFLGFTHYCGLSRQGRFKLKRHTSGKKFRIKLRDMRLWFGKQLSVPVLSLIHI